MRLHHRICLGIALLAALSACTKTPKPDPSATVIGQSPTRPDFNTLPKDPSFSTNPGASAYNEDLSGEGLMPRDSAFNILEGEQIRNVFPTIYFDFDQSFVRPVDRSTLEQVADALRAAPDDYLLIEGYCDWKGTTEYNLALGDRRATSVKDYIISLGIDPSRVEILSKGDLEAAPDAGPEGRALDRKAELVIVR
ncbi:OmpA family protein [Puniceicoccus vermicola]|nr:OmpA family protein [Puniceicoccus vermicola]